MSKRLKVGVFGAGRGSFLATNFMLLNCDIVAICEKNEARLNAFFDAEKTFPDAKIYTNFDEFIEHDMDAVILANYFNEHAPYAIKCFEKGIHVYSECISNGTMAEGVELVEAFEKAGNVIYMLAENYPQMIFNREMQRVCKDGTLGKFLYAEGEYNHPVSPYDGGFLRDNMYYEDHWRHHLPPSYYVTHSLGPVMKATGAIPKVVTCFATLDPQFISGTPTARYNADNTAIITTHNDDGSIFRVVGWGQHGAHHNAYRICGHKGQIENLRGTGDKIMLRYNDWDTPEGKEAVNCYEAQWNDKDEELIKSSGHGGGDFLTARIFVEAVRANKQPEFPFDVYSGTTMSSVAILGHRSMLEGGKPYNIPDFSKKEDRDLWRNDRLTPFIGPNGEEPTLPCCSLTDFKPTEEQLNGYRDLRDNK